MGGITEFPRFEEESERVGLYISKPSSLKLIHGP